MSEFAGDRNHSLSQNIRLISQFNLFLGLRFHVAIAAVYFAHVTGSLTQASIVLASIFVFAALFEVRTGIVSDRLGRRRTAVAGAAASVISIALYAVGLNVFVLLLGAMFEGLRRSLVSGNNEALLFESLQHKGGSGTYAMHFGKTESYAEIALAFGAPIGSLLVTDPHFAIQLL